MKSFKKEVKEEVVVEPVKEAVFVKETELEKLYRLHKELVELGINRIGQLEAMIAHLK